MRNILILITFFICSTLRAADFTIASYNMGALSGHYDYYRAAAMQKLMQERHNAEPEWMTRAEKIQQVALKVLFAKDPQIQQQAQQTLNSDEYQTHLKRITSTPTDEKSPNYTWNKRSEEMLTTYKVRPIELRDQDVQTRLNDHLRSLFKSEEMSTEQMLDPVRFEVMLPKILQQDLKYDIICLQETDSRVAQALPSNYSVEFADTDHSINGIAWNSDRFEKIEVIGDILGRGFALLLLDKQTEKKVLVASAHLSGCNPFEVVNGDSAKGDNELRTIIQLFDQIEADIKLIGMDSNVTPLHPRLHLLKDAGYQIDTENALENTCTNPYQIINTRIDWISVKSTEQTTITNIPVLNVGLNSIESNISDHKPIAAKINW